MDFVKTINVTIASDIPTLFANCNICGVIIHYEFGMTYEEAVIDLFAKHTHGKE